MLLNRRGEYAILGLIFLAKREKGGTENPFCEVGEVARETQVPANLLRVVFFELAKSEILRSQRGARGGFALGRPATDITLREIVEIVQGPVTPFACVTTDDDPEDCDHHGSCELYGVLRTIRTKVLDELDRHSLADLAQANNGHRSDPEHSSFAA